MIVSADATARQVGMTLEEGARAYVTKPIDVREFIEVVGGMLAADRD